MTKREIEDRLLRLTEEYNEMFEDGLDTFRLASYSFIEIIDMLTRCLEEGKDMYEMGYLTPEDPDAVY